MPSQQIGQLRIYDPWRPAINFMFGLKLLCTVWRSTQRGSRRKSATKISIGESCFLIVSWQMLGFGLFILFHLILHSVFFAHFGMMFLRLLLLSIFGLIEQVPCFVNTKFGLPSLVVPIPCQADVLYEQFNYICVKNQIVCLPGWTVINKPLHSKPFLWSYAIPFE